MGVFGKSLFSRSVTIQAFGARLLAIGGGWLENVQDWQELTTETGENWQELAGHAGSDFPFRFST